MKTRIVLMFSTTDSIGSAFLRWAQRCRFSHVEAVFPDYNIGARSSGVGRYTDVLYERREFAYIECTEDQSLRFRKYMEDRVGGKYDWRAYLGFMFFKKSQHPERWFCSELILEALRHAGISVVERTPAWFSTPRDFVISPAVKFDPELEKQLISGGYFYLREGFHESLRKNDDGEELPD